jgi:hypothetical protein
MVVLMVVSVVVLVYIFVDSIATMVYRVKRPVCQFVNAITISTRQQHTLYSTHNKARRSCCADQRALLCLGTTQIVVPVTGIEPVT